MLGSFLTINHVYPTLKLVIITVFDIAFVVFVLILLNRYYEKHSKNLDTRIFGIFALLIAAHAVFLPNFSMRMILEIISQEPPKDQLPLADYSNKTFMIFAHKAMSEIKPQDTFKIILSDSKYYENIRYMMKLLYFLAPRQAVTEIQDADYLIAINANQKQSFKLPLSETEGEFVFNITNKLYLIRLEKK